MATLTVNSDYFRLDDDLAPEELAIRDKVRAFAEGRVLPVINRYWEMAEFPYELLPGLAELGIIGTTIQGYGCPGMSRKAAGMVARRWREPTGASTPSSESTRTSAWEHSTCSAATSSDCDGFLRWPASRRRAPSHSPSRTTAPTPWRWRRAPDDRATSGSSTAASAGSATATPQTWSCCSPGTPTTARSTPSSWRRAPTGPTLPGTSHRHHRQDRQARDPPGRHRHRRPAPARRQPPGALRLLPRRLPCPSGHARRRRVGGGRPCHGRLRDRRRLRRRPAGSSASRSRATSWCRRRLANMLSELTAMQLIATAWLSWPTGAS